MGNLSSGIVGSSSGASSVLEKNYVRAPDAPGSLWVASGVGISVALETAAINLPESSSKQSAIKIQRASGTDYILYRFTLDRSDSSKKLKIAWNQIYAGSAGDYSLSVFSYTDAAYTTGATSLGVGVSSIPAISGSFQTTFDAPSFSSAPYIEVRITGVSGTAALYLSGFIVGPGSLTQGAIVSGDIPYIPTITGVGTGTFTTSTWKYRRVGDYIEINGYFIVNAAGSGAAAVAVSLPSGLSIDASRVGTTVNSRGSHGYGEYKTNGVGFFQLNVAYSTATTFEFQKIASTANAGYTTIAGGGLATTDELWATIRLPIAEWANSGTVLLGEGSQVEYAFNTDLTTSNSSTGFGNGPNGIQFSNYVSNSTVFSVTQKRVRFQYPIQNDEAILIEINAGAGWQSMGDSAAICRLTRQYNSGATGYPAYGMYFDYVAGSQTDIDVFFGGSGRNTANTGYGTVGETWGSLPASYRWRVRKAKASAPVGIDPASLGGFNIGTQSTSFTAARNNHYLVDTSANAVTATLPTGSSFSSIKFSDENDSWSFRNLTIQPAVGQRIMNLAIDEPLICDISGSALQFTWDGLKWCVDANQITGNVNVSSGSLITEKNYVGRPDSTNANDWLSSNVSLVAVGTEATPANLPENATKGTAIRITRVSGTTGYVYFRTVLDAADLGKKLKLVWNQKYAGIAGDYTIQLVGFTSPDYSTGSTVYTLQSSSVPSLTGTFQNAFDTLATHPYLELRIVAVSGTTPIYLSGVLIGPGNIAQGAALGLYESTSSYVIGATTTPPTPGVGATFHRSTYREGDWATIRYEFFQSVAGSAGTGDYLLPIPTGLTIDYSRVGTTSNATLLTGYVGNGIVLGGAVVYEATAVTNNTGTYANKITLQISSETVANTSFSSTVAALSNANVRVSATVRVPIAEWVGSGTLPLLSSAQVEYASNSSTTDANDSSSFVTGPSGAPVPGNLTALRVKTVQFSNPIQIDDVLILEIKDPTNGDFWVPVAGAGNTNGGSFAYQQQGTLTYGMSLRPNVASTTQVNVQFGQYANVSATATYAAAGTAWTTFPTLRYRVRKVKATSQVGFTMASASDSGLVSGGKIPGSVSGPVSAGYLGQVLTFTLPPVAWAASSAVSNIGSYQLPAGVWMVSGEGLIVTNAATSAPEPGSANIWFSLTPSASQIFGQDASVQNGALFAGANGISRNQRLTLPTQVYSPTVTTTYYVNALNQYTTAGGATNQAIVTAVRVG